MSLQKRENFKKADKFRDQRIWQETQESTRPFGRNTNKGNFLFNIDLVPLYNVPDLTGFKLKPYVPHITSKIPEDIYEPAVYDLPQKILDLKLGPEVFEPATVEEEEMASSYKK